MLDSRRLAAFEALAIGPAWQPRTTPRASESSIPVPGDAAVSETAPAERWVELAAAVERCRACALGASRQRAVFGCGSTSARWMLIGEAPGAEEDRLGEPFVGRAGSLLDAMLVAAGLDRARDVYIANILKCRPPANRNPEPDEVARCEPHLHQQIRLLMPSLLVLMGRFAAQTLLGTEASIASLRGRVHTVAIGELRMPAIVSYHPAYLLRNPADKRLAWAEWCLARHEMGKIEAGDALLQA